MERILTSITSFLSDAFRSFLRFVVHSPQKALVIGIVAFAIVTIVIFLRKKTA